MNNVSRPSASAESTAVHLVCSDEDVMRVRTVVRESAIDIGLNLVDQTKFVTAASEIARNTVRYGGGGELHITLLNRDGRRGCELKFIDHGPGIADIEQALTDGFTSGNGLGLGLGGAKRLVDEFAIQSRPGAGTTVTLIKWKRF